MATPTEPEAVDITSHMEYLIRDFDCEDEIRIRQMPTIDKFNIETLHSEISLSRTTVYELVRLLDRILSEG